MRIFLLTLLLPCTALLSTQIEMHHAVSSFNTVMEDDKKEDPSNVTLADVDAASDIYAPTNKIYNYKEAMSLKNSLHQQLINNPKSLAINWAFLRFYTSAPNFEGGNFGTALEYAGYIYSINQYIGCMAYEFVYTKKKDFESAQMWYKRSLTVAIPQSMHWENIASSKVNTNNLEVTGNFNNWKLQNMYETNSGTYARKVLLNKCENCVFKLVVNSQKMEDPSFKQELKYTN